MRTKIGIVPLTLKFIIWPTNFYYFQSDPQTFIIFNLDSEFLLFAI
uniref:Crooked neck-like protein 1 n=1 Tax=Rhizophora mucronata TaxID=61149 RepID=A0A2P2MWD8_RHIMU